MTDEEEIRRGTEESVALSEDIARMLTGRELAISAYALIRTLSAIIGVHSDPQTGYRLAVRQLGEALGAQLGQKVRVSVRVSVGEEEAAESGGGSAEGEDGSDFANLRRPTGRIQ